MKALAIFLGALAILGGANAAPAGTKMVVKTESLQGQGNDGTAVIYLSGPRARIDSNEGGGEYTVIYYGGEDPLYRVIDRRARTYVELTRQDMEAVQVQVEQAMKMFEEELSSAPLERREYLRQLFQQQMGRLPEDAARTEYKKIASGILINEWKCDHYVGTADGKKAEEVWAVEFESLDVSRDDFKVFGEMAAMFESIGQRTPAFFQFFLEGSNPSQMTGLPVLVVSYVNGERSEKSQLENITSQSFDPQLFDLPDGLTRQMMPTQE